MSGKKERSIEELYQDDPERADALAFGRRCAAGRRGFLGGASLTAIGATLGMAVPFARHMPGGLVPAVLGQTQPPAAPAPSASPAPSAPASAAPKLLEFPGKEKGLVLLGDRPLVAETPAHMLDDETTPVGRFFVRNNGLTPEPFKEGDGWKLRIEGETGKALDLTLGELKARFKPRTYRMVMECGGNGRSFFQPAPRGNQWTNGGIGCAEWTGVRLADVLRAAGLKDSAKFTGHFSADTHLSGDATRHSISRGMPIAKAMEQHTLIAWDMNGQPLTAIHGGPMRLVVPGWPGSLSSKWLNRIVLRSTPHDGSGMGGTAYRVPTVPIVPGANVDGKVNFKDLESMPTRSLITAPANGTRLAAGTREIPLRGAAWSGDFTVARVDVSLDFGQTWQRMKLDKPKNRYDWQRWTGKITLPSDGYFELFVRAIDSRGISQPHVAANWNPQGYGSNPFHRIAVLVG